MVSAQVGKGKAVQKVLVAIPSKCFHQLSKEQTHGKEEGRIVDSLGSLLWREVAEWWGGGYPCCDFQGLLVFHLFEQEKKGRWRPSDVCH